MNFDVIVVGGGLGGLTAGAKLAKEGMKVLLIEQHSQPGGCATTFRRGDYTLEVGLHEMDGLAPRDMKNRIFSDLGISGSIELVRVPEFYRFVNERLDMKIPHDAAEAALALKKSFPAEADAVDAYFSRLLSPQPKNAGTSENPDISVGEFLDSITANDDLKLVLLGNLGYFHDDPYSLSLAYYTIAQGSYFTGGASFIKGGSQRLSDHLAGFIRKNGGEVLLNHVVTALIADEQKLTGVEYRRRSSNNGDAMRAYGTEIIINSSVPGLAELLPAHKGSMLRDKISDLRPGASLLTVYLGFSESPKTLGYNYYSTAVFDSSVRSMADILANNKGGFERKSFIFVDYSQIDSGLAAGKKAVGAICCIDYLEDWENMSRLEYELKKEEVARVLIARLGKLVPGIEKLVEYYETGTARTVKRYTLNPEGAVYGFARLPGKVPPELTGIYDNLHVASAWGKTGGGFSGAIYSGYLCAFNILRKKK